MTTATSFNTEQLKLDARALGDSLNKNGVFGSHGGFAEANDIEDLIRCAVEAGEKIQWHNVGGSYEVEDSLHTVETLVMFYHESHVRLVVSFYLVGDSVKILDAIAYPLDMEGIHTNYGLINQGIQKALG